MARYEEIADTRPRIRRDVLYTRTPTGVLFHNAHGGFSLTTKNAYRFASLLVPHLDGGHSVADLCSGLGDQQRAMITQLVAALYGRGFARDAGPAPEADAEAVSPEVAARFGAQLEYIDHYVGGAAERFARYRRTRVAVLGDNELARWCALSLIRNGCATLGLLPGVLADETGALAAETAALAEAGCELTLHQIADDKGPVDWDALDGYDLVVVTAGARQTARLLEAGIPPGRRLLPAWTIGDRAVLGPVMAEGRPGCWVCAALRLGAGADPADSAELWSRVAPLAPLSAGDRQPSGPLAAMLGNLLGYEVFRLTTEALPAETDGQLVVQHLDSLDVAAEPLLPHPRCPRCATLDEQAAGRPEGQWPSTGELDAADRPRTEPADGAAEEAAAQQALAELDARAVLVRAHAGLCTEFADDSWQQTPLKVGTVRLNLAPGARRKISAFDVHHVAGARLRALYRAAEVYADRVIPAADPHGRAATEDCARIEPAGLATASGVLRTGERPWRPARSLLTGERLLVPAAALRPLAADNAGHVFEATSAGTGAGGTLAGAITRALRSALAYDALRRALRGAATVRTLPLDLLEADVELTFLARSATNLGLELELLRLGGDPGEPLPVVLARATEPGAERGRWALGGALSLREAVLAAARDLLGLVQLGRDLGAPGSGDAGDPLVRDLDPAVLVAGADATGAGPGAPADRLDWAQVLERLREAGRDVLVAPAGAPDLRAGRIEVVKVLLTHGTDGTSGAH
ncbi:TOMM precursor leader peptide-binding protein [Kitasatospora sp. NBC_01250]|uniref:TOMM precursor leader peptide-binding protein n=1 Tax=Kitasatospora sp. NBC_01250 TaxID=2903571 RepID=UPI002E380FCC|nr:TOMM precursor leader peptide-binding protein [Kitasatospora sp. NBC_01250]